MKFSSLSALNVLGRTPFSPGALSLSNFLVDFLISYRVIGGLISSIASLCLILPSMVQSMGI